MKGVIPAPSGRLRVDHQGGDRFRIAVRGHIILVDQAEPDGGEDTAPTPTELFVAGLASCVGFYARRYLTRHSLPLDGLAVIADSSMASHPSRVGEISLRLHLPASLDPTEVDAVLAFASRCTVHNSLRQPPSVRIEPANQRSDPVGAFDRQAREPGHAA